MSEEPEEPERFPDALVLALGELEKLTLGTLEEYWALTGEVERESTVMFEFVAYSTYEPIGRTRGKHSYDVEWIDLPTDENERFPTFILSFPRRIYDEYVDESPRVRLFMTLVVCEDRWKVGYCGVKGRLKWF